MWQVAVWPAAGGNKPNGPEVAAYVLDINDALQALCAGEMVLMA